MPFSVVEPCIPSQFSRNLGDAELQALPPTFQAADPYPSPNRGMPCVEDLDFRQVGDTFLGFNLNYVIGQGAFAKVYLARQKDLGNRQVVLKLSSESAGEINVLSQLLHSNIVPVYSVHRDGALHAVCMPFLGTATLADVVRSLRVWNLPDSGKYLVKTLQDHRSTHRSSKQHGSTGSSGSGGSANSRSNEALVGQEGICPADAPDSPKPATQVFLEQLQGLSYVNAVLWLAWQVTDGLAHAHERGIIHRDLKPANVLLTDEGRPMLLDFNLARDTKIREADGARLGGTLPYMSPEQLRALGGNSGTLDARSDIFSLGVLLYELLTGNFPFPGHNGPTKEVVAKMLKDRHGKPPSLRKWNPAVSPAVEAIMRHCLEADPDRRYQSARALQEDLQRQRDDLPLKHVVEPCWRERAAKWVRRHPRLTAMSSVAGIAALLVLSLAVLLFASFQRISHYEAVEQFHAFSKDTSAAHLLAAHQAPGSGELDRLMELGKRALERYGVESEDWRERGDVKQLSDEQRQQLAGGVQGLLLMMARARAIQAQDLPLSERAAGLQLAMLFNERAERDGAAESLPRALWSQRAQLLAMLGDKGGTQRFQAKADAVAPQNGQDAYLSGRDLANRGRLRDAIPLLKQATSDDPRNLPAWFLLGRCHDGLSQDKDALACYTVCIALEPDTAAALFFRGVVHLRQKDHALAEPDFTRVLALEPGNADAYFNRALARDGMGRTKDALADLDQGIALKTSPTRVYFARARLREKAGDRDGASEDRAEGLKREPDAGDELSWSARGFAKLAADPKGAMADFNKAIEINPRSAFGLMNAAHVLADKMNAPADAVAHLDRMLAAHPDHIPARTSRGILLARLGKDKEARQDAADALHANPGAAQIFRAACIYSLTSRRSPADAVEAIRRLKQALKQGHGFEQLETNADLDPLRHMAEFGQLVDAAKALR
ncbi:MAG: tetratricopeptide repeat protein [Planctomycetes bacterium]|nr:tetratricopeptide repeat protein [Planctomycetota bacterium]